MKKYMVMVEKYLIRNLSVLSNAGDGEGSVEALRGNSYTVLNVSPRAF